MGSSASADIVYGQALGDGGEAPDEFEGLYDALPEEGPLKLLFSGDQYTEFTRPVVYVRSTRASNYGWENLGVTELGSDMAGIGALPYVSVNDVVNAKKLWRHLDVLPNEPFRPRWLLIASYG